MGAFFVGWAVCAIATAVIAAAKGRDGIVWLILGGLFGFFAVLYVAFAPRVEARAKDYRPRPAAPEADEPWRLGGMKPLGSSRG